MGSEQDALLYLKKNVSEIKNLGKEWGLTEDEIDQCIERSLKVDIGKEKIDESKHFSRKCWSTIRFAFKVWCIVAATILILFLGIYLLMVFYEPADDYVNKVTAPYGYAAFRYVRLAALPFHKWFQFTELYDSECLVDNPVFNPGDMDCQVCHHIRKVLEQPANSTRPMRDDRPGVIRNYTKKNVTFDDLIEMYKGDPERFDSNTYNFQSNNKSLRTLNDMFQKGSFDKIKSTNGFHSQWESKRLSTSAALRMLYPRPTFIRKQSEVTLEKILIIDGPNSPYLTLKQGHFEGSWLIQSYGKRTVFLRVPENCIRECQSLRVVLNAGDAMYYDASLWAVELLPTGKDASITFQGGFSML